MEPTRSRVTDFIDGHSDRYVNPPVLIPDWTQRLEHRHLSLAEALRDAGYRTAHVGKWHLTPTTHEIERRLYWPEHHGFEINVAGNRHGMPGSFFWPYRGDRGYLATIEMWNMPPGEEGDYLTDALTDEAVKIIDYFQDEPFFLYFPYYTVHVPIEAKPELTARFEEKVEEGMRHRDAEYAAMIASLDESVGRILDRVEELGIADRTSIILTGDNGGLVSGGNGPTDNAPLRDGKGSAYEGGVRVPGIVRVPGTTAPGSVCDEPIIGHDLYPTILELCGVEAPEGVRSQIDGLSLVPVLSDPGASLARDALYWHYPHYHTLGAVPHSVIREGPWRLVEFHTDESVELYDLAEDIGETRNLAEEKPRVRDRLRERLHEHLRQLDAQMPTENPEYDPASPSGWPGKLGD